MTRATSSRSPSAVSSAGSSPGETEEVGCGTGANAQSRVEHVVLRTHGVEQARDDLIGVDAVGFGLEVHEDAVPQDRQRDLADVLDRDDAPALEQRERLRRRGAAPARRVDPRPSVPMTGRTRGQRPTPVLWAAWRARVASRSRRCSRRPGPRGRPSASARSLRRSRRPRSSDRPGRSWPSESSALPRPSDTR